MKSGPPFAKLEGHLICPDTTRQCASSSASIWFYDPTPEDMDVCLEPARAVHEAAARKFGEQNVFFNHYNKAGSAPDFPVMAFDGSIVHSHKISEVMRHIPKTTINYVFIQPDLYEQANVWLEEKRAQVIKQVAMEEEA